MDRVDQVRRATVGRLGMAALYPGRTQMFAVMKAGVASKSHGVCVGLSALSRWTEAARVQDGIIGRRGG